MVAKKKFIALLILLVYALSGYAQKQDYIWLVGYYDSDFNGQTKFDFNYDDTLNISRDSIGMNFDFTNTSYCDSNGNLLFYSNGIYIANFLDETIENSNDLSAGYFEDVADPDVLTYGYPVPQGILAVGDVTAKNLYHIIHSYYDTINGTQGNDIYCAEILHTVLDINANPSLDSVLYKNQPIIQDDLGSELTATRHGNGRDWWVLVQKRNSNCYYRLLIDTEGVHVLPDLTCTGDTAPHGQLGAACFSPDGTKYVYLGGYNGINIYDFDRCSGMLTNPRNFPLPVIVDSGWIGMGVAISPSNQYLYVSVTKQLYQFDLTADSIFSTIDTVGIYDGFKDPFGSLFNTAQSGPNGEIYINCGNSEADYHVITNPNGKGDSCNFLQHAILTPTFCSNSIPNFPNYRLGPLVGSVCDTIYTETNEVKIDNRERILKVFPNPATDIVTVDYGFTNWSAPGAVSLEIVNELGQIVYSQSVPQYSGYQRIEVSRYASGIYTAYIKRNEQVVAAEKFAKE